MCWGILSNDYQEMFLYSNDLKYLCSFLIRYIVKVINIHTAE